MRIDFAASERHWVDHLVPVCWEAADQGHEVRLYVKAGLEDFVPGDITAITTHPGPTTADTPVTVCASWADGRNAALRDRRVILMEHGAGQSYSDRNPSYVGGRGRERFVGVLLPNEMAEARHRRFYHNGPPSRVIGSPRVDHLVRQFAMDYEPLSPPVLVCSWHWDCDVLPETSSAFEVFGPAVLRELMALERRGAIRLFGHSHPRATGPRITCEELGIPWMETFAEVCLRADVYMVDNSSTLYEFAALDRPVIVMNSPHYRRRTRHGLRFWDYSAIGPNLWGVSEVFRVVAEALQDRDQALRRAMVEDIYPYRHRAAKLAVEAIVEWA